MFATICFCVAFIQAGPVAAERANRFQSSANMVDMGTYHPTVDYVPHSVERRPKLSEAPTAVNRVAKYELVAHASVGRSEIQVASATVQVPKTPSHGAAPKLQAAFKIPVPDDLTLIQPKTKSESPAKRLVVGPLKTSSPRIERILGIDSAHLSATTSATLEPTPPATEDIPVPSLGS